MRPHFECISVGGALQIFLKSCHGATVVLDVEPNDTTSNVRAKFKGKEGHPTPDERTLSDFDIQREFTLHAVCTYAS